MSSTNAVSCVHWSSSISLYGGKEVTYDEIEEDGDVVEDTGTDADCLSAVFRTNTNCEQEPLAKGPRNKFVSASFLVGSLLCKIMARPESATQF